MRNAVAMLTVMICAAATLGAYAPPEAAIVADRVAEAITNDLNAGRMPDAVDRVQALLTDENVKYVRSQERLLSVRLWVESQLGPRRDAFVKQYDRSLGPTAATELSGAARDGSVHAIMRIASRYPWTDAARRAPEAAARAAIERGDVASAKALVTRIGSNVGDPKLAKLDDLRSDNMLPPAAFSAGWYRSFFPGLEPRAVPVASKEITIVATPNAVIALAPDGKLLWTTGEPKKIELVGESRGQRKSIPTPHDRSVSMPAVWCDVSGKPRVVVARFVQSDGAYLRAYRADDGHLLWSTADDEATREMTMTGAPAAAGGYVYFNALKFDAASGMHTLLGALDLVTGKLVWSTDVGEMHERVTGQQKRTDTEIEGVVRGVLQTFDASTQITLDPHHVYAVFGPWVVAVDRFSGEPVWFAKYPNRPLDAKQLERERKSKTPPLYRRWRDAAVSDGQTVVIAPMDSDLVLGLDAATGTTTWQEDGLRGDELVGASAGRVMFAGASLTALDMGTGQVAWQNALPDADFEGPAFLDGDFLGVMTNRGIAYFDIDKGLAAKKRDGDVVSFDALLRQAPARQALLQAKAIEYFDPARR